MELLAQQENDIITIKKHGLVFHIHKNDEVNVNLIRNRDNFYELAKFVLLLNVYC